MKVSCVLTVGVLPAVLLFGSGCAQHRTTSTPTPTGIAAVTPAEVHSDQAVVVSSPPPPATEVPAIAAPGAPGPVAAKSSVQVIPKAPPPPQVEVVGPPPAANHVWIPGKWEWHGSWIWSGGKWVTNSHPEATWIPGRWVHRGEGWVWIEGYWR